MSFVTRSVFALVVLCLAATAISACENLAPGPSLTNISVGAFGKQATTDQKDPSLCCCRATGTVTNRNSVAVYLTMTLTALDLKGAAIERVLYFVPDLGPGQTRDIDVPGFVVPCNAIGGFVPEIAVKGLAEPPL